MTFYRFILIYILGKSRARIKIRFVVKAKFKIQKIIREGIRVLLSLVEAPETFLASLSLLLRERL